MTLYRLVMTTAMTVVRFRVTRGNAPAQAFELSMYRQNGGADWNLALTLVTCGMRLSRLSPERKVWMRSIMDRIVDVMTNEAGDDVAAVSEFWLAIDDMNGEVARCKDLPLAEICYKLEQDLMPYRDAKPLAGRWAALYKLSHAPPKDIINKRWMTAPYYSCYVDLP